MSTSRRTDTRRGPVPRHADVALALVALVCRTLIEALHRHTCTGDGCVLCLVAACSRVLLALSLEAVAALPVLRRATTCQLVRVTALPLSEHWLSHVLGARSPCAEMTPVTLGVRLLI